MSKLFIRQLMSLDIKGKREFDSSSLAYCCFVYELIENRKFTFDLVDFTIYIYRFYLDNEMLSRHHPNLLIKYLYKYSFKDLTDYSIYTLNVINLNVESMIKTEDGRYHLQFEESLNEEEILARINIVIGALASKYLDIKNFAYNSNLTEQDYSNFQKNRNSNRFFNRALENINYCFICEEISVDKLEAVQVFFSNDDKLIYNLNNYIVLCNKHAILYKEGKIQINIHGFLVKNGEIKKQRLPIQLVKMIRKIYQEL